ncbi:kinase C2 domain-containing protein [Naegleria gruberi]|uniref:Kinase C2 domain-containing protein n=1 Tax=Naegleria gruberi TaxID=5762 RepID=D2VUP6_NAEGR|nr:kinase C2 domain-containing protein [Naegleria gruberi]EFC39490.1 kinase C2 domain-containing protein [Naegleria gruberi]|eukprot:XP_002672234.1 kinase C2 domain-containing protein [Naegleria gruberi strain NEG-M]
MMNTTGPPSLNLTIHSGYSLPKADLLSSIDAYCVVYVPLLGGKLDIIKTKVIDDNANPTWNAALFRTDVDASRDMLIEVWDKDALKDEIVCRVNVPLPRLWNERYWNNQKFVLECLGKHKPYKGASECGLVISAFSQISFADLVQRVNAPNKFVDPVKKILVYPIIGVLEDKLYLKVSITKRFKVSILDTSLSRNLALFEIVGRDVGTKIITAKSPKTKFGITYRRKLKLKKCDPHALANLKLLVAGLTKVESKGVDVIVGEHGWAGSMSYDQAKKTLRNITVDEQKKRIFMNEANYAYMVDYDSSNFDQKIWLKEEASAKGYHAEFIYHKGKSCVVTSHQEPQLQQHTGALYRFSSQVKDSEYGTPFKEFSVDLYQRINPMQVMLSGTYLPLL